jgi:hypothetical protein
VELVLSEPQFPRSSFNSPVLMIATLTPLDIPELLRTSSRPLMPPSRRPTSI